MLQIGFVGLDLLGQVSGQAGNGGACEPGKAFRVFAPLSL